MKLTDKKGNLRTWVTDVIGLLGFVLCVGPMWLALHPIAIVLGLVLGLCLIGFSAMAIQSRTLDLRAFTKDPLKWREAKKTYKGDRSAGDK